MNATFTRTVRFLLAKVLVVLGFYKLINLIHTPDLPGVGGALLVAILNGILMYKYWSKFRLLFNYIGGILVKKILIMI